ncbi:unnamed protein product [Diamesa tonsa]
MIPAYQRLAEKEENESGNSLRNRLYTVSFSKFSTLTVTLPLASFLFCVGYSMYFFNEQSTSTHCHVKNYLPSISAAIGSFQPQAIIWQLSIILHFPARLTITWMYLQSYQKNIRKNRKSIAYLACIINVIENFTLLGLSLYTSIDSYEIHKNCFCTFILASEIYMAMSYYLNKIAKRSKEMTSLEVKSLKMKRNLFITNLSSILLAAYFFVRHNERCEPGVYTLFAFFEYVVVLTNMAFHMCAYFDFHNQHLSFDWRYGLRIHYR